MKQRYTIALLVICLLTTSAVFAQDVRKLYESAELEFQKGNYQSALSYLHQLEAAIGKKTPRVNALKAKVQESDGKVLDAKLSIEEYLRMANDATRASEGYADIPALKSKIDAALRQLEARWPQEIQKRRLEEADRIIEEQETAQERKLQSMRAAVARFEILEWQGATQENIADGYKAYADRYPNSSKIKEARSRGEAASYREAELENTAEAFQQFLEEYPRSMFALKAKDKLESALYIEAEREKNMDAYRKYLQQFPNGRYAALVKQKLSTVSEDDVYNEAANESRGPVYRYYAIKRYLKAFPQGKFAESSRHATTASQIASAFAITETHWLINYEAGVSAMEAGRFDEAAARFMTAIEYRQNDSENILLTDGRRVDYLPHRELGICLARLGIKDFAKIELQLSISYIWTLRAQEALDTL